MLTKEEEALGRQLMRQAWMLSYRARDRLVLGIVRSRMSPA